jgi:hypothetical protein
VDIGSTVDMCSEDTFISSVANRAAHPLQSIGSGTYSYEKWLRARCTVAPAVEIKSLSVWAGAVPTGVVLAAGLATAFQHPVSRASSYATVPLGATPLVWAANLSYVGDKSPWLVLQLFVDATAELGDSVILLYYSYVEL